MNKIIMIACYFGKLPEWTNLWLLSCSKNKDVDFLLVTDQDYQGEIYENTLVLTENFLSLQKRFQKCFDFPISLNSPYKLCDFKPLYGLAFKKEIEKYKFWGHCDLDVIFGDLNKVLKNKNLEEYNKIGNFGHMTIYHNSTEINNLYKKKGSFFSWKHVYKNKENFNFDETPGMSMIAKKNRIKTLRGFPIANISTICSRFHIEKDEFLPEVFYWENGKIFKSYIEKNTKKRKEYLYIHFSGKTPKNCLDVHTSEAFYITSKEFINKTLGDCNKNKIMEFTEFKTVKEDKVDKLYNKKEKIKKVLKLSFKQKIIWLSIQIAHRIIKIND